MFTSDTGIQLIKKFEGCSLKAYRCPAGILTIGYGHTGNDVKSDMTITQKQADDYLKKDLAKFEATVNMLVKVPLKQNQFDALVSFTYNLGGGNLAQSTLLKLLNQKKYTEASQEFKKWIKAGNKVLPGLIKRRSAEAILFSTGKLI